jgi:glycosyltransferase involved in cell wall biosynthesis
LAILEGMALDVPVIAVRSRGPLEYIEDGVNGFLVEADCKKIADVIENMKTISENVLQNELDTVKLYDALRIEEKIEHLIGQ